MSPRRIPISFLLVVAGVSAAVHSVGDEAGQPDATYRAPAAETQIVTAPSESKSQDYLVGSRLRGVNSCAAASCHGGGRVQEGLGFAASQIWARSDPHSRAWEVLTGPTARKIMAFLNTHPGTAPIQATEDTRCLNCHVTTEIVSAEGATAPPFQDHDGVGCESCHGPAGDWLAVHSTPAWKSLSSASRQSLGFLNNNSLVERAKLCARCHVGGEGQNVTHIGFGTWLHGEAVAAGMVLA
ncbi:MAG: multiheme c-type cytochrome, partial [Planctomycetia bacterium]